MNKPTLYIFCGLPFSGKTVLTKKLTEKLGFASVNIDDIKFAHGYEWADDDRVPDEAWDKIFQESFDKTLEYLTQGKSVLYDCANQDRFSRDRLRGVATKGDFLTKVIHVDTPVTTVRERWLKNKTTKERFDLPEKIFQEAIDSYEPPTEDENTIVYNPSEVAEEWIEKHFDGRSK